MESRSAQLTFGACVPGPPEVAVTAVFADSDAWDLDLRSCSWPLGAGSFPSCLGVFARGQLWDLDLSLDLSLFLRDRRGDRPRSALAVVATCDDIGPWG